MAETVQSTLAQLGALTAANTKKRLAHTALTNAKGALQQVEADYGNAITAFSDAQSAHQWKAGVQLGQVVAAIMKVHTLAMAGQCNIGTVATAELRCDAVRVRRGHEVRLLIAEASIALPTTCDAKLVALLAEAQAAAKMLFEHPS